MDPCTQYRSTSTFLKHELACRSRQARNLNTLLELRIHSDDGALSLPSRLGLKSENLDTMELYEQPVACHGGLRRRIRDQAELSAVRLDIIMLMVIIYCTVPTLELLQRDVVPKAKT